MEVFVTPEARKQIKKLPKFLQIAVIEKLKKLGLGIVTSITKLTGYKDVFRIRVGDYRVVYRILNNKIYVVLIGHRREVYKLLGRLFK